MKILNIFRQLFKKEYNKEENCEIKVIPVFDKKYKVILEYEFNYLQYYNRLDWVNENSNGSVEVKFSEIRSNPLYNRVYYAFENADDATFFKIKYGN